MAQIVKLRGKGKRAPLSAESLRLLKRLATMQRSEARASIPAAELLQTASQRAVNALLALDNRSLIAKAADGGLRLTRLGWARVKAL